MRFSTASVRTNMSRRTQCSNGLQPSADSKRDCPNSRGNLFFAFFFGGGKWVMIRETNSLLKKHLPENIDSPKEVTLPKTSTCQTRLPSRKHRLAKRGQPLPKNINSPKEVSPPRKHRRKLAWEAVCADHTHIITMITLRYRRGNPKPVSPPYDSELFHTSSTLIPNTRC